MAAFVKVQRDHVPIGELPNRIGYDHFSVPAFGIQKHPSAEEVGLAFAQKTDYQIRQIEKDEFLKIALFDLWLANEDRHQGNYNLMLAAPEESPAGGTFLRFMPIDHQMIFNSGEMDETIVLLTEDESLLQSTAFDRLYRSKTKLKTAAKTIVDLFPGWVQACHAHLGSILASIPKTWGIDLPFLSGYLDQCLFDPEWVEKVKAAFIERLKLKIN